MKKLSIIALLLSLCVICIGCSAQSENKTDTEGKTSVSSSESGTTLKRVDGGEEEGVDVIEIDPDDSGSGTDSSNANSNNKKETTTKKNSSSDKKDDSEDTTSSKEPVTTPVIPIP
ncbi:MAG: hypothetical protein E7571_04135 [Ruminococcaceae bacterium]|nr:hypothetical protein [Oscillospiraceae bacterium]